MALAKTLLDPTGTAPVSCYIRIVQANFSFADKSGLITLYAYRDRAARDAGKQPLQAFQLQITSEGRAAVVDPLTGATTQPAEPGFDTLVERLQPQFDALRAAFYDLVKGQSQFAGASDA